MCAFSSRPQSMISSSFKCELNMEDDEVSELCGDGIEYKTVFRIFKGKHCGSTPSAWQCKRRNILHWKQNHPHNILISSLTHSPSTPKHFSSSPVSSDSAFEQRAIDACTTDYIWEGWSTERGIHTNLNSRQRPFYFPLFHHRDFKWMGQTTGARGKFSLQLEQQQHEGQHIKLIETWVGNHEGTRGSIFQMNLITPFKSFMCARFN